MPDGDEFKFRNKKIKKAGKEKVEVLHGTFEGWRIKKNTASKVAALFWDQGWSLSNDGYRSLPDLLTCLTVDHRATLYPGIFHQICEGGLGMTSATTIFGEVSGSKLIGHPDREEANGGGIDYHIGSAGSSKWFRVKTGCTGSFSWRSVVNSPPTTGAVNNGNLRSSAMRLQQTARAAHRTEDNHLFPLGSVSSWREETKPFPSVFSPIHFPSLRTTQFTAPWGSGFTEIIQVFDYFNLMWNRTIEALKAHNLGTPYRLFGDHPAQPRWSNTSNLACWR